MPTINKILVNNQTYDIEDTSAKKKFVSLTEEQSIAGTKTFSGKTTIEGNSGTLYLKNNDDRIGASPTNNKTSFAPVVNFMDKNDNVLGLARVTSYTDGHHVITIGPFISHNAKYENSESYLLNETLAGTARDKNFTNYINLGVQKTDDNGN
jgi:hypothetical protein